MNQYEVRKIDERTWSIEDGFVRFFLLAGTEKVLLIDSGVDLTGIKELALEILHQNGLFEGTTPELELLNTHGDGDHCFGNREFDWFYMHEGDWLLYQRQFGPGAEIHPIREGDVIDLGERPLEIIEIPGHTFGSVAILDIRNRVLYPGDSVQSGDLFLFGDHREPDEFPASLMKLDEIEDRYDVIYASHADLELPPEAVGDVFDAFESVLHGEVEPEKREVHGTLVNAYDCETVTFLMDRDCVYELSDPEDE